MDDPALDELERPPDEADRGARGDPRAVRRGRNSPPPDILYHATTERRVQRALSEGTVQLKGGKPVFLSRFEWQAWHVAHRQSSDPAVLIIDAARARREGMRFDRNNQGLWQVNQVLLRYVLNLRDGYAEQVSAGGIPVWYGPDGPRCALIRVHRRAGGSWEVAKGKLEIGETPTEAAVREVREEMGYPLDLRITHDLGFVRYGFQTPDGSPRLKTLHMYLMETPHQVTDFAPAGAEGIREVSWFTPQEASRVVNHRSLRPIMRRLRLMFEEEP